MKQGDRVRIKISAKDTTARGRSGIVLAIDGKTAEVEFDDESISHWFDLDDLEPLD
jgi:hypothetical protein